LDAACRGCPGLRAQVEALLAASERAGDFLKDPAVVLADTPGPEERLCGDWSAAGCPSRPLVDGPGTRLGPYKLVQQIGEGGMGIVSMAEQERPVRRRVALKIIKPGMDTKQVLVRFEAERQALALMDHPNIARVLDGGTTEAGRPYFVMELVQG